MKSLIIFPVSNSQEEIGWKRKKTYFFDEVGHLLVKFPFWGKCPALKMLITQAT